jgi:hypothetical protein
MYSGMSPPLPLVIFVAVCAAKLSGVSIGWLLRDYLCAS